MGTLSQQVEGGLSAGRWRSHLVWIQALPLLCTVSPPRQVPYMSHLIMRTLQSEPCFNP
jgi:hypothetical protein